MNNSQDSKQPASARYTKRKGGRAGKIVAGLVILGLVVGAVATGVILAQQHQKPKELNVGLILEPTNLNIRETSGVALEQVLLDNVYQGLVALKPGTVDEYEPALAHELPEVSADGLTYSFKLRQGVKFHDGASLDANDVVQSLTDTLTPEKLNVSAVAVTSDAANEVTIKLSEPNSLTLWYLAGREGVILDSEATNDLANTANGTGPYTLERWKQGNSITLNAAPDYWGDKASLERVNFKFFSDGRAAVNAIKNGDLDVHTALLPSLRGEFAKDKSVQLVRANSTDVFTLAFNSAKAPLDNPEVRRALSMALDTEAIIASQSGDGKQLGSPITELEPGYANLTGVNSYDPEAARALLAAAGATDLTLTVTAPNFYDRAPLDLVVSQLKEAGVDAKLELVEFGTWLERVYTNGDYDISYVDHAEAHDFANYANPAYYFGYQNPEVTALYHEALRATSPAETAALLQQAAGLVAADAPAKWLYNYTPTLVLTERVSGFPESNTNSRINLHGVTLSE